MSTAVLQVRTGHGWRRALSALGLVWLLTLWLHRDTLLAMVGIWDRSETFAHAWLVPPITAWLVWRLRAQVLALQPEPVPWLLLPLAGAALLWLLGDLVSVAALTQFSLVAMLVLAVPALLGRAVTRVLLFPLGFIFFCVPVGEFMTPALMHWTAEITVAALRASGIPVYQEGLQFVIPSGSWSVVEACSGIRYLIASVMVGTLFAYLNYVSLRRRLLFVGISIIVPLLANWLRAYMIVMLGHLSGNTLAVGADHLVYGWVLFGVIIMALYWIGARWAEPMPATRAALPSQAAWPAAGMACALLLAGLVAAPLLLSRLLAAQVVSAPVVLSLPEQLPGGWQHVPAAALPDWPAGFINPSASQRREYRTADGSRVAVQLHYYRQQDDKRKLISSVNRMVGGEGHVWNLVSVQSRRLDTLELLEGRVLHRAAGTAVEQRLRLWQTYWIDGRLVAGNLQGKLWSAYARLAGRGDDGAVLQLAADDADPEAATAALSRFSRDALVPLQAALQAARAPAAGAAR